AGGGAQQAVVEGGSGHARVEEQVEHGQVGVAAQGGGRQLQGQARLAAPGRAAQEGQAAQPAQGVVQGRQAGRQADGLTAAPRQAVQVDGPVAQGGGAGAGVVRPLGVVKGGRRP